MRDEVELAALQRTTVEFIASNPTPIVLRRRERVSDGAGGWIDDALVEVDPQVCKIQRISRVRVSMAQSPAGEVPQPTHEVIGLPGMNVKANDTFTWNGHEWNVVFVDDTEEWVTNVEVVRGAQVA